MNPTVEPQRVSRPLVELAESIQADLQQVELLIRENAQSEEPAVQQLLDAGLRMGGKRLRPMLLLLVARAAGDITTRHHLLGCVIEMIHTATLVHDDVLDNADVRRHQPTVHSRWGNHSSVLLGDYLFSRAFFLASTLESTTACQIIGRATSRVCEGEIIQVAAEGNLWMDEGQYLEIIRKKTGELCSCAAELGAMFADADPDTVRSMRAYGMNLGCAFQIADDVLDLVGNSTTAGKTLGTDLHQLKMTLPLIQALSNGSPADRNEWSRRLAQGAATRQEISDWLQRQGALDRARIVARQFSQRAIQNVQSCGLGDDGQPLIALSQFVIDREM